MSSTVHTTTTTTTNSALDPQGEEYQKWWSRLRSEWDWCQIRKEWPNAPDHVRSNKKLVLAACQRYGQALQYASKELKADKEVVLTACHEHGLALQYAEGESRSDKEVVLVACQEDGWALQYACEEWKADKEVVLVACQQNGWALKYACHECKADKQVVLVACQTFGWALEYACKELQADEEIVLAACQQNGMALGFASNNLKANKDIVLAAAASDPESLKFSLGGLNQDQDCLVAAGLWDEDYNNKIHNLLLPNTTIITPDDAKKIVLSTKFSLHEGSKSQATKFAVLLKQHNFIQDGKFSVYSPNAFGKDTCDLHWTRSDWPCRGTFETCQKEDASLKRGVPQANSCWRYSFRYQLEQAKLTNGFMIQVVDLDESLVAWGGHKLGDGQTIESEMAQDVAVKVFRVYVPRFSRQFDNRHIDKVVSQICRWYDVNCKDISDCHIEFDSTR